MIWSIGPRKIDLTHRGLIMGILNVTPDSFSDGGSYANAASATERALQMIAQGADIIDIGGESTRPGAEPVSSADEIARTEPVIAALRAKSDVLISIDTSKAEAARRALASGADIINDVTGLTGDPEMIDVAAASDCGVVIMHMQGTPQTMQQSPHYDDVIAEVGAHFRRQMQACEAAGITPDRVVFDPGIGFGKELPHNLLLLREIDRLTERPQLVGASRKSFIGKVLDSTDLADRLSPTVALTASLRSLRTPRIFRVHDVAENVQALRMAEAILTHP